MALADYQPERATVVYKGKVLVVVRGLCLDDISVLVRAHMTEIRVLYARYQGGGLDPEMIAGIITEAPGIAAHLIALASDEPEATDTARKLPAPLQVQAVIEILRLTFEDVGGPKAFVALVAQLVDVETPFQMPATIQ